MNRPLGPCSAPGRSDWRMGLQTLCFGGDGMERIACPSTKLGAKFSLQGVLRVPRLWLCRSEEHTSELQSRLHLVCRLLLEKKKIKTTRCPIPLQHSEFRITPSEQIPIHQFS